MFSLKTTAQLLALTLYLVPALAMPVFAQSSAPPQRPTREGDPNEYYQPPSTFTGKTVLIPIGSTMEGRMDRTISSEHSHTGQRFNIVISTPVMLNGTDVVVPAGSSINGEVVEAMPASRVPPAPFQDKRAIRGKLRIALSGLKTPDGVTYPLVASVEGEVFGKYDIRGQRLPPGMSVGYVGTNAQFASMDPSLGRRASNRLGQNRVVGRRELLQDEMFGAAGDPSRIVGQGRIRALVLKGRDYWVYEGSPLTIKLDAPFKIGVATPSSGAPLTRVEDTPVPETLPPPSSAMQEQPPQQQANSGNTGAMRPRQSDGVIPPDSF